MCERAFLDWPVWLDSVFWRENSNLLYCEVLDDRTMHVPVAQLFLSRLDSSVAKTQEVEIESQNVLPRRIALVSKNSKVHTESDLNNG